MRHITSIEERFWRSVNKDGVNGCWEWMRPPDSSGYGQIEIGRRTERGTIRVHRLSWEIHHGIIPEGQWVLHKCDNRICVNPSHLFLGDNLANMMDMNQKGRHGGPKGTQVHTCKLSEQKVLEILTEYNSLKEKFGWVSKNCHRFGISRIALSLVVNRKMWKWVVFASNNSAPEKIAPAAPA
jgi:hypothetical protein